MLQRSSSILVLITCLARRSSEQSTRTLDPYIHGAVPSRQPDPAEDLEVDKQKEMLLVSAADVIHGTNPMVWRTAQIRQASDQCASFEIGFIFRNMERTYGKMLDFYNTTIQISKDVTRSSMNHLTYLQKIEALHWELYHYQNMLHEVERKYKIDSEINASGVFEYGRPWSPTVKTTSRKTWTYTTKRRSTSWWYPLEYGWNRDYYVWEAGYCNGDKQQQEEDYFSVLVLITITAPIMWEKLQRFGLDYCDLPTIFENLEILMRLLSLKIDNRREGIPVICVILTVVCALLYFYVHIFSMLWFVFWSSTDDMVAKLIILSLGIGSLIGLVKLFFLHLNSTQMKECLAKFLSCDARVDHNGRMYRNLLKYMRVVKRRAIFVWCTLVINGTIYMIKPFLMPGKHLMEEKQILYGLEPMNKSPNYEISQTLVGISAIATVYTSGSICCLMIIITGYVQARMLALTYELTHFWDDSKTLIFEDIEEEQQSNEIKIKRNKYVKRQLDIIVQAHVTNLSLVRSTENLFRNPIAMEFLLLGIALIAELLGGLDNTYMEVPFTLLLVGMDCFSGQLLVDASMGYREAVYACGWEEFEVSNMKAVLVILENSREMMLSAGGVAELNYVSLMSVFKSVYSAYTTLLSTMD